MGDSKTIEVKTSGGVVIVRRLALGEYAGLLRAFKQLPAELGRFLEDNGADTFKDNQKLFAAMPELIADALPDFCAILAAVSDHEADWFEKQGDLADGMDVFAAAMELNNYQRIVTAVKKLIPRPVQSASPASPPPPAPTTK